jgi:dienelactone hydrolase
VEKDKSGRGGQPDWRGVVAYYPDCGASSGTLTAPALVLVGERDDWAPAASCRKLAAHESDIGVRRDAAGGTPIDLVVYPDATHAFDYKFLPPRYMGHVVRHDEAVSRDAEMRVHAFLRDLLGDQPDKP